jgi:hypothetical protein
MSTQAQVLPPGHTFTEHDLPEPHEFIGVITKAVPVVKIDCSCGYSGLATIKEGATKASDADCPACVGRADAHKRSLNLAVAEVGKDEVAVQEMVSSAVNKAVGPLMDLIDKLNKQVSEQQSSSDKGKSKGGGQ